MINRIERQQRIKSKGFNIPVTTEKEDLSTVLNADHGAVDFSKIKVGAKRLEDATIELGSIKKVHPHFSRKEFILELMHRGDLKGMREASNFFYKTSGIYARLCRYMAYLYKYDWMIVPYVGSGSKISNDKIEEGFNKALQFCDDFELKKFFGDVALKVVRNGCYYGYLIESGGKAQVQELPPNYCRTRYDVMGNPAVEFNMAFFNDYYPDKILREKILKLFPKEFEQGYRAYMAQTLPLDFPGDTNGWVLLDIEKTFKFNLNGEDYPAFISVIPAIIDLDNAQGIDRKKLEQQLLKIIIQTMPIDKNGDLVFDVDEAQALHNNAVKMLGKAVGIDVLTTFADVEVADMAEKSNTTTDDTMDRILSNVYTQSGIPQAMFNSNSNLALEKSILNDEAMMYPLVVQFETFINKFLLKSFNKSPKKICYKAQILHTTIYNYKDLAKMYKEHTQLGYSKFLPQIALGQSQRAILASARFENEILDLVNVFIPPLMSSTMNGDFLTNRPGKGGGTGGTEKTGRKELEDDKKSDKTIANRESM